MTLPLFDQIFTGKPEPTGPPLTGQTLRDSGMQSAVEHTPEEYKQKFNSAIEGLKSGTRFTAEDIRAKIGDPPSSAHYNCFGALISGAARKKLMRPTGETVSAQRPSLHASKLAIWVRL